MSSKRWCSLGQTPRKGSGWLLARALSPLGCMPARERGQALVLGKVRRHPRTSLPVVVFGCPRLEARESNCCH